jgi:RHS repeat-associated protein
MKKVLIRSLMSIATVFCLLFVQANSANAKPGIQVESSGAHYGTALYEEIVVDLEVKVMGGMVKIKRQWKEETEGKWIFNFEWGDLDLASISTEISRHGYVFKRLNPTSNVYRYLEQYTIVQSETGFRWADRLGNWIDYDTDGKILSYGDRNNVKVRFNRDASGRISQVLDHFGTVVVTFSYDAQNRVASVADYSGRQVVYTYTGNDLTKVKDVRGYDWTYEYQTLLGRRVLSKKIDPEGRYLNINHAISPGGSTCIASSGGSWLFNEEKNRWELVGGKCTRYSMVSPTLIFTGTSDAIGIILKNQFFFDAQSKTYHNTWLVNGRRIAQKINLRGEVLREEINGELHSDVDLSLDRRRKVVTDGAGNRTIFEYDEYGNQTKIIYPDGSFEGWTYDQFSNVLIYVDSNGIVTNHEYDNKGNLIRATEAKGLPDERVTEYKYDEYGNQIEEVQVGDAVTARSSTRWVYDQYGNIASMVNALGGAIFYEHDVMGNVVSEKYNEDKKWAYVYDEVGDLKERISPMGGRYTIYLDKVGNQWRTIDELGLVKTFEYNSRGLLSREVKRPGTLEESVVSYAYDDSNNLISEQDPNGGSRNIEHDSFGRIRKIFDANGNVSQRTYFESAESKSAYRSLPRKIDTPSNSSFYEYDFRGRPIKMSTVSQDASEITYWRYDKVGNLIAETDPEGHTTAYEYNAFGDIVTEISALNGRVSYQYDDRGNVIKVTDQDNNQYEFHYDQLNRLIEEVTPDGGRTSYLYDEYGNLIQLVDPKGNLFRFDYDLDDRKIRETQYSAGDLQNPQKIISYTYNSKGQVLTWNDGVYSGEIQYNDEGKVLSESIDYGEFSKSYSYSYDKAGLIKSYTDFDQVTYTYTYDGSDRLVGIDIPGMGVISVNNFFSTVPSSILYPGGLVKGIEYDGLLSAIRALVTDAAGNVVSSRTYNRNSNGQLSHFEGADENVSYGYDAEGKLESATFHNGNVVRNLKWDKRGNLSVSGEAWAYNSMSQLLSRPGYQYTYDENGNQILVSGKTGIFRYSYDMEDRLIKVSDEADITIAEYAYDPFDRRIWKKTSNQEIYFAYNNTGLAAELNAQGQVVRSYGYSPYSAFTSDPLFLRQEGQYYFYVTDHRGSPVTLVTPLGEEVWSAQYDELGKASVLKNIVGNPLRNPGQYEDVETGLYYNFRRYYDPETARYITADPLGLDGGINRYLYAEGDPVNSFDPTGEIAPIIARGLICMAVDYILSGGCTPSLTEAITCFVGPFRKLPNLGCGGGGRKNSFTGDTLVATRSGLKPISEIVEGEEVLSYSEWDGKQVYSRVDDIITGEEIYSLVGITLSNGDTLEATPGHPFFIKDIGWIEAEVLEVGNLLKLSDGRYVAIGDIQKISRFVRVYNLSVAKTNTYYIGNDQVLVHNAKKGKGKCNKCRNDSAPQASSKLPPIPWPSAPKGVGMVTCTCRATQNQHCQKGSNQPVLTAMRTVTAKGMSAAQKQAKDEAKKVLGHQPKHDGCKCIDSKGKKMPTIGG